MLLPLFSFLFRIQRAGRNSKAVCRSNGPDGSSGNVLITSKQRRKKKKKKRPMGPIGILSHDAPPDGRQTLELGRLSQTFLSFL